jgi:tetratricopeptide (TPR) repeat protein
MFYIIAAEYHHAVSRDHGTAMQYCHSGLELAISMGSVSRQATTYGQLARIKTDSGDFPCAKKYASEAQRVAKIAGLLDIEAAALTIEAMCWQYLGNYSHCIPRLERATHLLDLCGLSEGSMQSDIRHSQAEVHRCKSEYMEARNIQTHILHNYPADRNPYAHALALINIIQIDIEICGTERDVQGNCNIARSLFQKINYSQGLIYCDMVTAAMDVQQGKYLEARRVFQKCLLSFWGNEADGVAYILGQLSATQQWGQADDVSFNATVTFLAHSAKFKQRFELHKALQFLGDVFQEQEDQETAISLFTVALDAFTEMDVHRSRAECMVRLGDISKLNGDELKAAALWETARPLFERSSQRTQLADLNVKLAGLSHTQPQEVQEQAQGQLRITDEHSPRVESEGIENIDAENDSVPVSVDS